MKKSKYTKLSDIYHRDFGLDKIILFSFFWFPISKTNYHDLHSKNHVAQTDYTKYKFQLAARSIVSNFDLYCYSLANIFDFLIFSHMTIFFWNLTNQADINYFIQPQIKRVLTILEIFMTNAKILYPKQRFIPYVIHFVYKIY